MKQIAIQVVDSLNVAVTGLTDTTIDVRVSPYGAGDKITGLTVTEIGTGGNYTIAGATDWYENVRLYINTGSGFVLQSWFGTQDFGDMELGFVADNGTQTVAGAKTFSSVVACSTAASSNTHLMRYGETVRIADSQSITGLKGFVLFPYKSYESVSELIPSALSEFGTKYYIDTVLGGAISMVQSDYLIRLMPSRTSDDYSKTTGELCNSYLAGLTDISTRTGVVLVEPLGQATNTINLDDGTSQWISAGVFYVGVGNKPILNRRAPNSSLTATGGIINCRIKDGATGIPVVASRAYTNFTFKDCEFDIPDETDVTFTTCKFIGINKLKTIPGNTITLTNCTGDMFWYNDTVAATVVITGTQPCDVRSVTSANLNW